LDIEVKQGELVCIVGEIGSGKSSLLNAIFGEMAHVSDKFVEKVGGMDSTHTGADYLKLQRDMLAEPIDPPIVRRGTVSYVE
jgi:ABC-type lipoprotein export system ATPase subunit